ncbi:hypothetical protein M2323_000763 [Rhodoblastus acidophilus]|uniref:hypothetical protein n=1 Tax=Rhodoblastus acidophilus TaxID=1074 RepID=UPI0022248F96|nr:hypothetical protein [Rhodoblastus acidophilus]MCW2283090.1 hypothetical protein [Rhodoblastus acidophilus]MCW2331859.1 hypothetical protein [Rhodoblastus acidophilus]
MDESEIALRDIAAIHLRFALADLMIGAGKPDVARALDHLREADACLQVLLMARGEPAGEPRRGAPPPPLTP